MGGAGWRWVGHLIIVSLQVPAFEIMTLKFQFWVCCGLEPWHGPWPRHDLDLTWTWSLTIFLSFDLDTPSKQVPGWASNFKILLFLEPNGSLEPALSFQHWWIISSVSHSVFISKCNLGMSVSLSPFLNVITGTENRNSQTTGCPNKKLALGN